jgi:hypothetical protein
MMTQAPDGSDTEGSDSGSGGSYSTAGRAANVKAESAGRMARERLLEAEEEPLSPGTMRKQMKVRRIPSIRIPSRRIRTLHQKINNNPYTPT